MKISKLSDDVYRIEGVRLVQAPDTPEGSFATWNLELATTELARLSMLGAEILMADPAVTFVAG
jgi:hypothetical protein